MEAYEETPPIRMNSAKYKVKNKQVSHISIEFFVLTGH
jgi:hypothetical protein